MTTHAVDISALTHHYGRRRALDDLALAVKEGELFVLLGPNGGGKTTLFRLLSTLVPLQQGTVRLLGYDLGRAVRDIRLRLGVVFQAPSLDRKLTIWENLCHQGHLYGLSGRELRARGEEMLSRLGLADRRDEIVERLSGGLRRRAELAKGMLHRPRLMLLDEPSTGLDPAARGDLWNYLRQVQQDDGVTIVLTTHLFEEAEKGDRIGILSEGRLVALGTPGELRSTVGGDSITIETHEPEALAAAIRERFSAPAAVVEGAVHLEHADGARWVARLAEAFPGQIHSITVGKPSLEDVFIARTGHRFWRQRREDGHD